MGGGSVWNFGLLIIIFYFSLIIFEKLISPQHFPSLQLAEERLVDEAAAVPWKPTTPPRAASAATRPAAAPSPSAGSPQMQKRLARQARKAAQRRVLDAFLVPDRARKRQGGGGGRVVAFTL